MSFTEVLKGANRGLVSTHGQKPAQFSITYLRHQAVVKYTASTQKLGSRAFLESR
jgi:hypothetical protein